MACQPSRLDTKKAGHNCRAAGRDDQDNLAANQIGGQCRQMVGVAFRRAVFDGDILTLSIAGLIEPLAERDHEVQKPVR